MRRILPLAILLMLSACGGDSGSPAIEPQAAERLAVRAEEVAARLAVDDGCGAAAEARALAREAGRDIAAGRVPELLAPELRRAARSLVARTSCSAPVPERSVGEQDDEDEDDERDEPEGKGKGKGKGKGSGKGQADQERDE